MDHFQKIADQLGAFGLDAMLLTEEADRFYASGFFSSGSDGAALVSKDRIWYFTDGRYIEAAGEALPREVLLRETRSDRDYLVLLNEALEEGGLSRVGFEDAYMTVASYEKYRAGIHGELVPATELLKGLRRIKDPEELDALEGAQRIAERALDTILGEIRPGVTEKEIAARIQYLLLSYGASDKSFDPIVASGPNGSRPHAVPTERAIREGDFVTMDFGCKWHGYCSDMTRTVAVGHATDEMRRIYAVVLEAQRVGIETARAGVTGKAVDAAARAVIEEAGYGPYFSHSFGHGVGVEIHEGPNASSLNEDPLPAGAVLSAEPGIYLPGKMGVRIEDVIVIGEDGARDLMRAPKDLLIL